MKRNRNRILSVLLTLVIASMLLPTSAHAVNDITLTISANVSTVEVGGTVTFTLNLSGIAAEDKMNGIGFKIVLPSGLTLDSGSATIDGGFAAAWPTLATEFDEAPSLMFSAIGTAPYTGSTLTLGTFTCTATTAGSQEVTFDQIEILNDIAFEITTTPATATVTVTPVIAKLTSVNVLLTPPAKSSTPETSVGDTGYTGTVSWNPNDATFKADTVYTATVTLDAESSSNYAFNITDNSSIKVNGEAVTSVSDKTAAQIVFTKQFPSTGAKSAQSISFTSVPSGVTYGDTGLSVVATGGAGTGSITFAVTDGDAVSVDPATGALTVLKVGTANITATKAADDDYAEATATTTVTVGKITLNGGIAVATNRAYDGTTDVAVSITGFSGILASDTGDVSLTAVGTIGNPNAGDGKAVTISNVQVTGAKSANYNPPTSIANTTVDIGKATGLTAMGNTINLMEEDVAAKSEPLASLITLNKTDAGTITYSLGLLTNADSIFASVPAISGGSLNFTLASGKTDGQGATQVISVSSQNYQDAVATITFDITAKTAVSISAPAAITKVYDGTAHDVSAVVATPSAPLTLTYSGTANDGTTYTDSSDAPAKAGTYILTAKVSDTNPTYAGSANFPFIVSKAPITLKTDDIAIKVGESIPPYTFTTTGLVSPDTWNDVSTSNATAQCPTANANVANSYPIIVSGAALNNAKGANYSLVYENALLVVSDKSIECNVLNVISPVGATMNGTDISASVSHSIGSITVNVTVSADASWSLFKNAACTEIVSNNNLTLPVGKTTVYIKVTAENGVNTKIYMLTINRAGRNDDSFSDSDDSSSDNGSSIAVGGPIGTQKPAGTTASASTPDTQMRYRVIGNRLNVRQTPGLGATVIGMLNMNQIIDVHEITEDGWAKVTLANGVSGWCSTRYLIPFSGATSTGTLITTANLHKRSGAGTRFASLGIMPRGTPVFVTGYEGEWATATINGENVYLHSGYLK